MKYKVTLNDKVYEVEVEAGKAVLLDEYEACAPAPAAAPAAEAAPAATAAPAPAPAAKVDLKAGEPVNSPMPGNILRVEVKEGEQIKAGQLLVVLEAMKMENEIDRKPGSVLNDDLSRPAIADRLVPPSGHASSAVRPI